MLALGFLKMLSPSTDKADLKRDLNNKFRILTLTSAHNK